MINKSMKNILLEIINNDTSYNKSATKMLKRTHTTLWREILTLTSFLNSDAKPKQRVWHILNDCYTRPICPITGEYLKWCEKDYFKTSSRRAKQLLAHKNGVFKNGHTPAANEKRKQGNLKAVEKGRQYRNIDTYTEELKQKSKATCLSKYGVDNPSKHPAIRKKISDIHIKNGATPKELRPLRDLYYQQVKYYTEKSWNCYFDNINPLRVNRSKVDLDHIYSKQQGFRESIPPYIIGHWTNLQMLDKRANYSKGMACGKTQEKLFEDFFINRLN